MGSLFINARLPSTTSGHQTADIPMEQLVVEVYEDATPAGKNRMIAQLLGRIYEKASLPVRCSMLEQLLQPLGLLSLIAVANGRFAKMRFRGGWQHLHVSQDDARSVSVSEVIALADYVQQVSLDTVKRLAQAFDAPQMRVGSAATTVLRAVLLQAAQTHRPAAQYCAA